MKKIYHIRSTHSITTTNIMDGYSRYQQNILNEKEIDEYPNMAGYSKYQQNILNEKEVNECLNRVILSSTKFKFNKQIELWDPVTFMEFAKPFTEFSSEMIICFDTLHKFNRLRFATPDQIQKFCEIHTHMILWKSVIDIYHRISIYINSNDIDKTFLTTSLICCRKLSQIRSTELWNFINNDTKTLVIDLHKVLRDLINALRKLDTNNRNEKIMECFKLFPEYNALFKLDENRRNEKIIECLKLCPEYRALKEHRKGAFFKSIKLLASIILNQIEELELIDLLKYIRAGKVSE